MPLQSYLFDHKEVSLQKRREKFNWDWLKVRSKWEEVAELLSNKGELLIVIYFKLQKLFEKKYGVNTIVLMEIGTFLKFMK